MMGCSFFFIGCAKGFLDVQFIQPQKLQDESNPNFIFKVVSLFFEDSEKLLNNLAITLGKELGQGQSGEASEGAPRQYPGNHKAGDSEVGEERLRETKAMTADKRAQRRVVEYVERTFERWGSGLFIDGVMGRVHGSRRDPRKDKRESRNGRIDRILVEIDQAKYSTSPKSEEEIALHRRPTDEYPDSGFGELSGDSLARFRAERWTRFTSVKRTSYAISTHLRLLLGSALITLKKGSSSSRALTVESNASLLALALEPFHTEIHQPLMWEVLRSSSSRVGVRRSGGIWRIVRLFKRKKEKRWERSEEKSEMWVFDYMGVVSRSRSLCSFRGGFFEESSDFAFSSSKISDATERPNGFSEVETRKGMFPIKESDFSGMDESGFVELKLDLEKEAKA
ncbi:histone superfamily protein [Actinidia rufa]|uniref:Histidine-containing phosphotransfer protein n=1 Tax=Actinidia rufa TaxID=165716 RepID=A0A7J0DRR2_9ERIC|nr:histone superfamily protein [Actinidia rufa]